MPCYQQGKVFRRLKEKVKFANMVKEFKVNKSTMIFKINIVKVNDKYPKLMMSLVTLIFLKTYFKNIKKIPLGNSSEFK